MSQRFNPVQEVTATDFDAEVLERSHETPVLVDFWAPWCSPCKALAPTLETLAVEYRGRLALVKLDTEAHPSIADRYKVRGIPNVKLFVGGKVAGQFTGVIPRVAIEAFLDANLPP